MKPASRLARWLFRRAGRPVQAPPFAPRFDVLEDRLVPDAAPNLALRFTADNPTPAESDLYGYAVAASGDKVLVGSKQDDTGAHNAGNVDEYDAKTGRLIRTIDNPFPGYADHFGDRLAFVGDDILVGCHYNDKFALNAGAVYLFSGKTGNLIRTFYSPSPMENALFGYAVTAVGTDKVLIGAERDSTKAFEAGAAYLFDVHTGALLRTFDSPTPDAGDRFGISVAAVGTNEVLIGAHYDDTKGEDAGAAYLFDVNTGALISTLTSPDPHPGDKFGYAVAGADGRALVGAYADDHAGPDAGAAYLYAASGHLLQKYVTPTGRAAAEFGWSVAFAGKDVLVGAPQDANGNGATYLFSGSTGALLSTFGNPRPDNGRMFGFSVAADGLSNIAVGSPRVDTPYPNCGAAYFYGGTSSLGGSVWSDLNNDGIRQTAEFGIAGATVTLTGTDARGNAVRLTQPTDADGFYKFTGLTAGTYTLSETQPTSFLDGKDRLGTAGGTVLGNDQFSVKIADHADGLKYNFGELRPASLVGSVYADANNNGTHDAGEPGIAGVKVSLTGTDDLGSLVSLTATTAADGSYSFAGLRPGTYAVTESEPAGYPDGKDTVGTAGGVGGNDATSGVVLTASTKGTGYDFGELPPASLAGSVYVDGNNDGVRQAAEVGIGGATATLTGTDDLGNAVRVTVSTAADGSFLFANLRPGVYAIAETQPAGYVDGKDAAGTLGGTVGNDVVSAVTVRVGNAGGGYTFGETGQPVSKGQTATIGFWANNGQKLIRSFGTTQSGLTLANWLAASLPKLYGQGGMYDLRGKSNADVASLFVTLFNVKGQKTEAQILATALAVFTTTDALDRDPAARAMAAGFGFQITTPGVGTAFWNVGSNNAGFGLAANSSVSVLTLLQSVNDRVSGGKLFGGNQTYVNQANAVFDGINRAGDI